MLYRTSLISTTMMLDDPTSSIQPANQMTPAEENIEFASRLCYMSLDKLGTNPNFINGLIKAGHMDVLEHSVAAFEIEFRLDSIHAISRLEIDFLQLVNEYRHLGHFQLVNKFVDDKGTSIAAVIRIGGNLRTWYEILYWRPTRNQEYHLQAAFNDIWTFLRFLAPNIFSRKPKYFTEDYTVEDYNAEILVGQLIRKYNKQSIVGHQHVMHGYDGICPITVAPMAYSKHLATWETDEPFIHHYNHMSIWVDGVSRAFSHQHVRHRLLSFSQLSQRYVDFAKKQDYDFVYPPGVLTDDQRKLLDEAFEFDVLRYEALRASGMKKEDARCILPNAATTSLVFSGYNRGLEHYINLRTASDAQWEIREVAKIVQYMYETVYP